MRVTNPEIEERTDEITLIEAKGPRGQKFILVDGGKELQPSGADAPGALEGGALLSKDKLLYVTALEDLRRSRENKPRKRRFRLRTIWELRTAKERMPS